MKYLISAGIILLCLTGCGTLPFQKAPETSIETAETRRVLEDFSMMLPDRFQIISSISFEYMGHSVSFIGYSDIDAKAKRFTVAGLNQVGIKLFEITGDNEKTELKFAVEEFTNKGNFAEAVAGDIRKIYFDRLPSEGSKIYRENGKIIFVQKQPDADIEFVFDRPGNRLIEKRCIADGQDIWKVNYKEYRTENGKLHPSGIILENIKYGYRLTMRLKEIRA